MKKKPIVVTILVLVFLLGGSACSLLDKVLGSSDPIGDLLAATSSGPLEQATSDTSDFLPILTPEPTEDPYGENGPFILMLDDFSDPTSGWEESSSEYGHTEYKDGTYVVEADIKSQYYWGVPSQNYTDIRIEVDATVLSTNPSMNDGFGVDCRIQPNGDGYGFRISSDGYAMIAKYVDTEYVELMEWMQTDTIYTDGRTNHITAICQGDHLSLLVNDENVIDIVDDTFSAGDIALSAISFEDTPIVVAFDDIVVQQIGNPYEYGDANSYSVTIENPTTYDVCYVFITTPTSDSWGYSLLDDDEYIFSGESKTFDDLPQSIVDIRVETCQTLPLLEVYDVNLLSTTSVELLEPQVLVAQPFTDLSGWPSGVVNGGVISNTQGEYYTIEVTDASRLITASSDFVGSDVKVQTDAALINEGQDSLGLYGVTCRMQPDGSGIFFAVRGDGMGSIIKIRGGQLLNLTDWQEISNIDTDGGPNYIQGDCLGSYFDLYVNGDYQASAEDDEFSTGEAGVAVFSTAGETVMADFDFLNVYAAE